MTRSGALAFVATVFWAAPAAAEEPAKVGALQLPSLSRMTIQQQSGTRRAFAYPIAEYEATDPLWQSRQGIIAGKQVAPGTILGVGIFRTTPKLRGHVGDVPSTMAVPKHKRSAAVGLSWQF